MSLKHRIQITIKNNTFTFATNKKPKKISKLLNKAEKHFDFSFLNRSDNTDRLLPFTAKDRMSSHVIPQEIYAKILESLPEYSDISNLEVIPEDNGDQSISKHDCASAILGFIKAYDNNFEFEAIDPDIESLNDYLSFEGLGSFLND